MWGRLELTYCHMRISNIAKPEIGISGEGEQRFDEGLPFIAEGEQGMQPNRFLKRVQTHYPR